LSGSAYFDYRPVVQTASLAFLGKKAFKAGNYDENYLWLGLAVATEKPLQEITSANVNRVENSKSTVFLQALNYTNRPAHADQLHVDLWHKGENIALDPGTFQYNAAPPWDNGLARSLVHNTISFDGLDQMTRYSRFLWLDWANARIVQVQPGKSLTACHDGYRRLGIRHQRSVECQIDQGWLITDFLILSKSAGNHIATLNWNFPDEQYHFLAGNLEISFDKFKCCISFESELSEVHIQIIKGGKSLTGESEVNPLVGWYSPTYGIKIPCISFQVIFPINNSVKVLTKFTFGS